MSNISQAPFLLILERRGKCVCTSFGVPCRLSARYTYAERVRAAEDILVLLNLMEGLVLFSYSLIEKSEQYFLMT